MKHNLKKMDSNNELIEYYSQSLVTNLEVNGGIKILNIMGRMSESACKVPDPLHLSQVVVNAGGKIYIINADGLKELDGEPTNRGTSVFVQLHGEGQGVFETQLQFHKGIIFKETLQIAHQSYLDESVYYDKDGQFIEELEAEYNEKVNEETVIMIDGFPRQMIQGSQDIWRD